MNIKVKCRECGHTWELPVDIEKFHWHTNIAPNPGSCPKCGSRSDDVEFDDNRLEDLRHRCTERIDVLELDKDRVKLALAVAMEYINIDGNHHKSWVIDRMVRLLTGRDYPKWRAEHAARGDGPNTYDWDEGIAP